MGGVSENLKELVDDSLLKLQRESPYHLKDSDRRGRGERGFLVHKGYEVLLQYTYFPGKSKFWANIWHWGGPPKDNIFCWTLSHGKILIGENVCKKGFPRMTRCSLCYVDSESIPHLFLVFNSQRLNLSG
jgi:hypothetical protein